MSRILARSQFLVEIVEAGSGEEAVQCARQSRFDVVLLDLNMPVINGVEAASQLLAAKSESQIAMVSTEQQANMVRVSQFAGAFAFLKKPFDEQDVDAVLHKAFDMRHPSLARATYAIFADEGLVKNEPVKLGRSRVKSGGRDCVGRDQAPPTSAI